MTTPKPNGWEQDFDKRFEELVEEEYNPDWIIKHEPKWIYADRKQKVKAFISQAILSAEEEAREKFGKDTERLDFLDKLNKGLNDHYGTNYGWEMVINHNVNRIFSGSVNDLDLNDATANGYKSCREAIDKAKKSLSLPDQEQLSNSKTE